MFFTLHEPVAVASGVSAIRKGRLIFAVGEVTAVPLGSDVSVKIPHDLLSKAQALFRHRDPEFEFADYPIAARIVDSSRTCFKDCGMAATTFAWSMDVVGEPAPGGRISDGVCNWHL
jgi:hypothetical protein